MIKCCENCYWKFKKCESKNDWCAYEKNKLENQICDKHSNECSCCFDDKAEYKYKDKYYCSKCLLEEFGVEEYTETHYMLDGEYLGSEDDISEVIENLYEDIEMIE